MKLIYESSHLIYDFPRKHGVGSIFRKILWLIQSIFYRMLLLLAPKKNPTTSYNVVICAIFKNEAKYLDEWIRFHQVVGVDHFYLYNNNSTDEYLEVLQPYISEGTVTLIDWKQDQAQFAAYRDCISKHGSEARWIGFIDIDEFVIPIKHESIGDFLSNFEKFPAVKLYWQVFGTSGKVNRSSEGLVTEDFTVCWRKLDEVGKCFYNTSFAFDPDAGVNRGFHHSFWGQVAHVNIPPVNCFGRFSFRGIESFPNRDVPIQINHYFTKSYCEYYEKASRGDVFYKQNPHDLEYFYRHESRCGKLDVHAYKFLIKTKMMLGNH